MIARAGGCGPVPPARAIMRSPLATAAGLRPPRPWVHGQCLSRACRRLAAAAAGPAGCVAAAAAGGGRRIPPARRGC
eukprot:11210514-Lingulodinium_polyedra.AAC.1